MFSRVPDWTLKSLRNDMTEEEEKSNLTKNWFCIGNSIMHNLPKTKSRLLLDDIEQQTHFNNNTEN